MSLAASLSGEGVELLDASDSPLPELPICLPEDEEALQRLVQRAHRDRLRILPLGMGTQLRSLRPEAFDSPTPYQLGISLRRLQAIEYEPGDGTVTAGAGVDLATLARHVEAGGHRLTPDVRHPAARSLGGVLGEGRSGPERLRFGPLRHHVLGTRTVLATGERTKSGGRLVKNVTGYDLHRLYTGSRGTLALLTQASLRLFPAPERAWHLTLEGTDPAPLLAFEERLRGREVPPNATWLATHGDGWQLDAHFDGHPTRVQAAREGALAEADQELQERWDDEAFERSRALRDGPSDSVGVRLTCLPSQVAGGAIANLRTTFDAKHCPLVLTAWPGVAQLEVPLPPPLAEDLGALSDLRDRLAAAEVTLEPLRLPALFHQTLAPPLQPSVADWMKQLSESFDSQGTLRSSIYPCP